MLLVAELEDEHVYSDTELEGVDEQKSVILSLLSQLKLGMDLTKDVLDANQGFAEMGIDSLMGVELRSRIQKNTGVRLASTFAFDSPNISDVSAFLSEQLIEHDDVDREEDSAAEVELVASTEDAAADDAIQLELRRLEESLEKDRGMK